MKILILVEYFSPAYKAGGPINSIANLIKNVDEEFYLITSDRDLGDNKPFSCVKINEWTHFSEFKIYYMSKKVSTMFKILSLIKDNKWDLIYLNSFFSFQFSLSIVFFKFLKIIREPILLAPKGEFSPGFLNQKRLKKSVYLSVAKIFGIYNNIYWHASTEIEKKHIMAKFPKFRNNILVAEDITENINTKNITKRIEKRQNNLKICFLSRIHEMKNLLGLIDILKLLPRDLNIEFNIYGPVHSKDYWQASQRELSSLNESIKWKYHGAVSQSEVFEIFLNHHLLFLPTYGENYGHVILESLSAGCLVLISDNTPWNEINNYDFGRAINLNDKIEFKKYIEDIYRLDDDEMSIRSKHAIKFSESKMNNSDKVQQNKNLFNKLQTLIQ